MPDLEAIAERLSQLTIMEAAELSRLLEDRWGVSAAAPVAIQAVGPDPTPAAAPPEAPTEFNVILAGIAGDKKITVIKEIRAITGLGLKEAKEFTESAGPKQIVKEGIPKTEAESLKKRLEDAGARITLQ